MKLTRTCHVLQCCFHFGRQPSMQLNCTQISLKYRFQQPPFLFVCFVSRYTNGITYFFKDSLYYRFNDTTQMVDPGYPRPIASFWKGVPDNFDTVYISGCGHVYFFKENLFYRFNQTAEQADSGFPKSLALWRGILYQP